MTNGGLTFTARGGRLRLAAHAGATAATLAMLDEGLNGYATNQVW